MSPTVNNFVHDLVAMAKAMEDLPVVQAQAEELARQNGELAHSVQAREESILKLKAEIDALHAKVRSTEAERDDAEMRFLELDEKAHKVLGDFEAIAVLVNAGKNELTPPKPEPVPAAQAEPEVKHEEATSIPVEQSPYYNPPAQDHLLPVTSFEEVPKSDANPSQDTALAGSIDSGDTALHSGASTIENASAPVTIEQSLLVDDVGYHNEPDVGNDWSAWNAWCERMRLRYGTGAWPQRPDNAAPSVA